MRPRRFQPWKRQHRRLLRGVFLPAVLLVLLGLWLFDPDTLSHAGLRDTLQTVERVDPRRMNVIDGDTVRLDGATIRLIGYDTPETFRAECDAEKQRGDAATDRLRALLEEALRAELTYLPRRDQYGRALARLTLDDRDVAEVMVGEGFARRYNGGQRRPWC